MGHPAGSLTHSGFPAHRAQINRSHRRLNAPAAPLLTRLPTHRRRGLRASGSVHCAADPYQLLGVPRNASAKDIKSAFRKKALKLHPDVNKAPDAAQKFAEAKAAYQTLLDPAQRAAYDGKGTAGGRSSRWDTGSSYGTGGWGSANRGAGSSSSGRARQPAEEEYSFGQFWSDLNKEVSEWSREQEQRARASGRAASSAGKGREKSLWEELNDIGGEFVEFLEQELGLEEEDDKAQKPRGKYDFVDDIDRKYNTGSTRPPPAAAGASASSASASSNGSKAAGSGGQQGQQQRRKTRAEEVEDELAELKRQMGL